MQVLITNIQLCGRSGTEMYVHDLSLNLRKHGHTPIIYSPQLGRLAEHLARRSIPVVDSLDKIASTPDVIHGHHALETMAALLHFPATPGIFVCHDFDAWHDTPPLFPRIYRYVAVDETCRERLALVHAIDSDRIHVLHNSVDINRFRRETELPAKPKRALVFSNYASVLSMQRIRTACKRTGLSIDAMGCGVGKSCDQPEQILPNYDIVFAKGRCAREAISSGCAVIVCDVYGMGGLVTRDRFDDFNGGRRFQQQDQGIDAIVKEIRKYDPADAKVTSEYLRATTNSELIFGQLTEMYREVIEEHCSLGGQNTEADLSAAADFVHWWSSMRQELVRKQAKRHYPTAIVKRCFDSLCKKVARRIGWC